MLIDKQTDRQTDTAENNTTLAAQVVIIYIIKGDMFICLYVLYAGDGRPNGWADQDQTWHRDSC